MRQVWYGVLLFIAGCFCCYVTLQWDYLDINLEVHVPELLATLFAAIVGLYIAVSIQRRLTRNQNQYSFIGTKLDSLWGSFNRYSENFKYSQQIDLHTVTQFHKEAVVAVSFLKTVLTTFDLKTEPVDELDRRLDVLETTLTGLPMNGNNVINWSSIAPSIHSSLNHINESFSAVLKQIHSI